MGSWLLVISLLFVWQSKLARGSDDERSELRNRDDERRELRNRGKPSRTIDITNTTSDLTSERPYGNVIFLLTNGRSGSSILENLLASLTECREGSEILGQNHQSMVDKPTDRIKGFIHHWRNETYRYHPHKVLCFKWKSYRDSPEYIEAWKWAAKNKIQAIYNTRNELDRHISNDKMHKKSASYGCKLGDEACVERNKKAVYVKTEGLISTLVGARKSNEKYEQHMKNAYGEGGYVRVRYDDLLYQPTLKGRLDGLQKFADAIWSRLSLEARTALKRQVKVQDFVSKTHQETHDYAQWKAVSNFPEIYEMLRNTTWSGLLHGSTVVPLDASKSLEEAIKLAPHLEPLFPGNGE